MLATLELQLHPCMKCYCHPPKHHREHERERINTTGSVTKIQILGCCEIGLLVSCKSTTGIQGASISSPSSGSPCSYQHILQSYNHSDVPTIPKIHKKPHYCRSQHATPSAILIHKVAANGGLRTWAIFLHLSCFGLPHPLCRVLIALEITLALGFTDVFGTEAGMSAAPWWLIPIQTRSSLR